MLFVRKHLTTHRNIIFATFMSVLYTTYLSYIIYWMFWYTFYKHLASVSVLKWKILKNENTWQVSWIKICVSSLVNGEHLHYILILNKKWKELWKLMENYIYYKNLLIYTEKAETFKSVMFFWFTITTKSHTCIVQDNSVQHFLSIIEKKTYCLCNVLSTFNTLFTMDIKEMHKTSWCFFCYDDTSEVKYTHLQIYYEFFFL